MYIGDMFGQKCWRQQQMTVRNSTCLGHFGRYDTDRIIYIYVAPHKVEKESKEGAIHIGLWCNITGNIAGIIALNFATVNTALTIIFIFERRFVHQNFNKV